MLFSIIIPVYQAEQYILKALESVGQQTFRDYELIVVDNGCTDGSHRIINDYIESHPEMDIKCVWLEQNQGISGGRNAGIEVAKGTFLCFLDADDWWYPNKLERVKDVIEKDPGLGVIGHWEDQVKDGKIVHIGNFRDIDNTDPFRDLLFYGNCLSPSTITVDAKLLKRNNGFDLALDQGQEDFDCWLRLAHDGAKFHMIKEALSVWLIRNDSLSAKRENHTNAVVKMLEKHFHILESEAENPKASARIRKREQWIYAMNYCGCARTMSLNGDHKEAYQMYKKSLRFCGSYWKSYAGIVLNLCHL